MKTKQLLLLFTLLFCFHIPQIRAQGIDWMKSFGGTDHDNLNASAIDEMGNIYVCGSFQGTIDMDPGEDEYILTSSHYYDTFVLKLNKDGEFIHAHSIGGAAADFAKVIAVDKDLNYYVSGTFDNTVDMDPGPEELIFTANGDHDIFFQKFNEAGELQWAFQLKTSTEDDELRDIAIDEMGNVYCTGEFYYTIDFDPGASTYNLSSNGRNDIFVLKLDADGNFLWAESIGGWYEDYGAQILIDRFGDLLIGGSFIDEVDFNPGVDSAVLVSVSVDDAFLLKLTSEGVFKSVKSFGGIANDFIRYMKFDNENNIIIGGSFRIEADFDPDPEKEYLVEGGSLNDLFVLKLDENGDFMWVRTLGGGFSFVFIKPFDIDSLNNIYFASSFNTSLDIVPGDSSYIVEPVGSDDFFIDKLGPNGDFISAFIMGSPYLDYINTVFLDRHANIYAVGVFNGNPKYELNNTTDSLSSAGSVDVFIQKFVQTVDTSSNAIDEFFGFEVMVYPNPGNGNFKIQSSDLMPGLYQLKVINGAGQIVLEREINNTGIFLEEVNLTGNGVFFIELSLPNHLRIIRKVIVN